MGWVTKLPQVLPRGTQFVHGLRGACTLYALAAADVVAKGHRAWVLDPYTPCPDAGSPENMAEITYRIYKECRKYNQCGASGSANQWDMLQEAARLDLFVADVLPFADPMPDALWIDFLHKYIAQADIPLPVLMQVSNGRALKDAESGSADEPSLQYHAFTLFGTKTDPSDVSKGGYVGTDGDNRASAQGCIIYNRATLMAAKPVSAIAFQRR